MDQLNIFHSSDFSFERYRDFLPPAGIAMTAIASLADPLPAGEGLSVLILDSKLAANGRIEIDSERTTAVVGLGLEMLPDWAADDRIYLHLPENPTPHVFLSAIRRAYQHLYERVRNEQLEKQLRQRSQELEELNKIGIALSTVRDHDVLLSLILTKARELSRSDAGSLYLIDAAATGEKILRWKIAQNDSIDVDFQEKLLPITKRSLAGYVACTGETLVIDDAYGLPDNVEYSINRSFDRETGYLTKSMLVLPMSNHDDEIIGVLQLINRRRVGAPAKLDAALVPREVVPFDEHTIELMRSLAGQAAVAVENNNLYESIERLFEGFVTASVTAIEQRDPTTSGHSFRVADLTVETAKIVDALDEAPFRDVRFTSDELKELRYASLLHDFGKVGVREKVLVKEKKLYPGEMELIRARFEFIIRDTEAAANQRRLDYLLQHGFDGFDAFNASIMQELQSEIERLERDFEFIIHANEPTVLPNGDFEHLQRLGTLTFSRRDGSAHPLLTPEEVHVLSIRKGNLDPAERGEIESHVTHTWRFLSKIPWTRDLRNVPGIAYAHHEKLNGRGYPRRLTAPEIPIQSRLMTVSDIYDALTAKDRPYKRAVATERALDILRMEAGEGLLDSSVVKIFVEAKVWTRVVKDDR